MMGIVCISLFAAAVLADETLVASFESQAELDRLALNNTQLTLTTDHATHGARAARIEFRLADWPNVKFDAGKAYGAADWRKLGALVLDAFNPQDTPVSLLCRMDDDPKADGRVHCQTARVSLPPQKPVTVALQFNVAVPEGMRGGPPIVPGALTAQFQGATLDLSHIIAFQLFLAKPSAPITLFIDNLRLVPAAAQEKFVDRFGQYAFADWPGKLHDEAEFAQRLRQEKEALQQTPPPADRDQYGGWATGPQLEATGWFRLAKHDNKWWFVTPSGHLFWSCGLDCVRSDEGRTLVAGREAMFSWLPPEDDPLAKYFPGRKQISFFTMNLHRKYGSEYLEPWLDITFTRLKAWGFNTIGNWSEEAVFRARRMPYTVPIHYGGIAGFQAGWKEIPDFFDPKFEPTVRARIKEVTDKWRDDPWCLGYFVDNELSWGGWGEAGQTALVRAAFALPGPRPVKTAFADYLRAKYSGVEALNMIWGTKFTSWDQLARDSITLPADITATGRADLGCLLRLFAERYFEVVSKAMNEFAPNQLYLGCRFAVAPDDVVQVAANFCRILSYNFYGRGGQLPQRLQLAAVYDKPVVIGEFHFGALDRGMFHTGLGPVASQEERGQAYAEYITAALKHPQCVGAHWFTYADQALTGRFDGENYNIGFINVTDTPYPELVNAARAVNCRIYQIRGTG